ncbi:hypothetical protein P5G50_00650 [Leifsonia sp. F6_8S_P_1B]|uniref:DUF4126 domain-containing protein n=1 Tax=Leifsonia williamsii TaxID=3035919 RepID=A0ABT8K9F2_9MICO|nr:hypothetical protein [Leifsonia williamsii]MDN4612944.1 hypothetical protein [Leifsonia williamsii]
MYITLVIAQTVVLPLVSGAVHLLVSGGSPLVVFGMWWAFWGVGTRLLVAGISQLANPARTTKGILGIDDAGAEQVVHELGYANLSLGAVALFAPFVPGWGILGALPGALYLGLAGLRHVAKRGKGAEEAVATWTDLLVFVVVVVGIVGMLILH